MASLEFRLKKIHKTRNYHLQEINIMIYWIKSIKRHVSIWIMLKTCLF